MWDTLPHDILFQIAQYVSTTLVIHEYKCTIHTLPKKLVDRAVFFQPTSGSKPLWAKVKSEAGNHACGECWVEVNFKGLKVEYHIHREQILAYRLTTKEERNRFVEIACLSKAWLMAMQPVLDLHSAPNEEGHGERFIDALLLHVFAPLHSSKRNLQPENYSFLYTAVYNGATMKPMENQAINYYRLLGHRMTALLRAGVVAWKPIDKVEEEFKSINRLFKYVDRFYVARRSLPPVVERLKAAYLAGNPNNPDEPVGDNPDCAPDYTLNVG
jgi:hypothetical protein